MGVPRKHADELRNDRRTVTTPTAIIFARIFGNGPEFWLNGQRCSDLRAERPEVPDETGQLAVTTNR
ncbi:MAG: hypothetical protein ACLQUZ_09525 [Rhizomicrobium sp.]